MLPDKLKERIYKIKDQYDRRPNNLFNGKIVCAYNPADLQIDLAKAYAEAIRDGELEECSSVNWKSELSNNTTAVAMMMNTILDTEKCLNLLRSIIFSWSKSGFYKEKYSGNKKVLDFLDWVMEEIKDLQTDDEWLRLSVAEQYEPILCIFNNNVELLKLFLGYIQTAMLRERKWVDVCEHLWYLKEVGLIHYAKNRDIWDLMHKAGYYKASETSFNSNICNIDRQTKKSEGVQKNPIFIKIKPYYVGV